MQSLRACSRPNFHECALWQSRQEISECLSCLPIACWFVWQLIRQSFAEGFILLWGLWHFWQSIPLMVPFWGISLWQLRHFSFVGIAVTEAYTWQVRHAKLSIPIPCTPLSAWHVRQFFSSGGKLCSWAVWHLLHSIFSINTCRAWP